MASPYNVCASCRTICQQDESNIFQSRVQSVLDILSQYKCCTKLNLSEDHVEDVDCLIVKHGLIPAHAALAVTWVSAKCEWDYYNDLDLEIQLRMLNAYAADITNSEPIGDTEDYSQDDYSRYIIEPIHSLIIALSTPQLINETYKADFEDCGASADFAGYKGIDFLSPPSLRGLAAYICTKYMKRSEMRKYLPDFLCNLVG